MFITTTPTRRGMVIKTIRVDMINSDINISGTIWKSKRKATNLAYNETNGKIL